MNDNLNFKAFEDGGADQLLRETMAGHRVEPKPGIWKGISRKLLWAEILHLNFTNLSPKFWLAGIGGLLLVATTIYFGLSNTETDVATSNPDGNISPVAFSANIPVSDNSARLSATTSRKIMKSPVAVHSSVQSTTGGKYNNSRHETAPAALVAVNSLQQKSQSTLLNEPGSLNEDMAVVPSTSNTLVTRSTSDGISHLIPYEASLHMLVPEFDTIIAFSNATGIVKYRKSTLGNSRFFSANIGIMPELAFYSEPDTYKKTNFWLDAALTYHVSRFSIATGVSLGYVYDEGKYRVEYKSRDSVGYFNEVTSYTIGTNNEITYNTQTINIYDSLQHQADYRTKNRYSYLQVPLLLGYRFFESRTLSLSFMAGPAISVLLGSRKSDPVIEYENARIIRIDDDTPARIQTNWEIWANLYFEMRMNKMVSLYLEPSFKYYLKPMVTEENVAFKAPWTIGLGVGLQFNFGQKTKSQ